MGISRILASIREYRHDERRHQIAVVVDEFGETQAPVTLEDFAETVINVEIVDENSGVEEVRVVSRKRRMQRPKPFLRQEETGGMRSRCPIQLSSLMQRAATTD